MFLVSFVHLNIQHVLFNRIVLNSPHLRSNWCSFLWYLCGLFEGKQNNFDEDAHGYRLRFNYMIQFEDNFIPLVFVRHSVNVSSRSAERALAKCLLTKAVASKRMLNESNLVALIGREALLLRLATREKNFWFGWAASDTCTVCFTSSTPAQPAWKQRKQGLQRAIWICSLCFQQPVWFWKFQMINICDRISSHKEHLGFHFVWKF